MPSLLKARLGLMMFVTYMVWGAWYVTLTTYLTTTLHFSGARAGAVFGTISIASMISPMLVGRIADRYFATEKVMAVLFALGAVLMYAMTRVTSFGAIYAVMLLFCMCYFPTLGLTNSIVFQHVSDSGREFPLIRLMGTFGWIVINNIIGFMKWETTTGQFYAGMVTSLAMVVVSLGVLPTTPPKGKSGRFGFKDALGLDAAVMLKDKAFLVFAVTSVLACIPFAFYFAFTNDYLNDLGVHNAAGKMTLGQASEVGVLLLMPIVFRYLTVRAILITALLCWTLRYLLLALGNAGSGMWMFYAAIIIHGVCYNFFYVTGQLYTDQIAPDRLRNTAQGFLLFLTFGIGALAGSLLSGNALDFFTVEQAGRLVHHWQPFWLSTAALAGAISLLVIAGFRTHARIQPKPKAGEAAGA